MMERPLRQGQRRTTWGSAMLAAKLRGSIAQTGNDAEPYNLTQTYTANTGGNGVTIGRDSRKPIPGLKPELTTAQELGVDMRFLNNRAGIEFTWYNSHSKIACKQATSQTRNNASSSSARIKNNVIACPPGSKLDVAKIEQITGMKGVEKNGEYKITVPQNDLKIMVDCFKITPPMGLGSWAAFTPCGDSAMVMGDIILTETDLKSEQQEVIKQGFAITAIHNHFVRNRPNVMYMHVDKTSYITTLSNGVKAIFEKVKQVRGKDPKAEKADSVVSTLNIAQLDSIIGHKGEF